MAAFATLGFCAAHPAFAATDTPQYEIERILVAEDQYQGEPGLRPMPIFKPHEVAVGWLGGWVTSNERGDSRGGFAGITVLVNRGEQDIVLAQVNIDEPGVTFHGEEEEEEHGEFEIDLEPPDPHFPTDIRLNPTLCLPVVLPLGATPPTYNGLQVRTLPDGRICAPLGAEMHARHPHGIDIDEPRKLVYQVIEHSGLKWNADRTGFEIAESTDEESGLLLAYDLRNPRQPKILTGYLLGHGAHEVAVNDNNGLIFQGNHEDSPGVEPNIWVDVIDPRKANPYGFIDTGFYNAVQGIEVDERLNVVFGTTHVGEKMFGVRADCVPTLNNPPTIVDFNGTDFIEKQYGENCILGWVDLLTPFVDQIPNAEEIIAIGNVEGEPALPSVLHMHDLTVDAQNHKVYQTLHSIHHAEHTGSPEEAALHEEEILDLFGTWQIESPEAIAGAYPTLFQPWSVPLVGTITAPMQYGDGLGGNLDGCTPFAADALSGLIVLVDRGNCNVSYKISNIGAGGGLAGVVGLIDVGAPLYFADGGEPQTIPGYVITQSESEAVKGQLAASEEVIATFDPTSGVLLEPEPIEEELPHHVMGRWVAEVDVNPSSPQFLQVTYVDLSNGFGALDYPNVEDVPPEQLLETFVNAHWVAVDPNRNALLVSGEHTGNLGVVAVNAMSLGQVVPISLRIPGCEPAVVAQHLQHQVLGDVVEPVFEEPHVHGVQIDSKGTVYVSDEGEHCFYESVTILEPDDD